jgi:hypothetical protein
MFPDIAPVTVCVWVKLTYNALGADVAQKARVRHTSTRSRLYVQVAANDSFLERRCRRYRVGGNKRPAPIRMPAAATPENVSQSC